MSWGFCSDMGTDLYTLLWWVYTSCIFISYNICYVTGSVSPSALHQSEFCNSSTDEIIVGSSGHLEGVIFSPKYPESRNGDYNGMSCTMTISGLHHGIALKLSISYLLRHNLCFLENLHEFQHIVPEFKLGRSENCSIRAVEKMIWGQSMIHIGLDRSLHSHERFIIKYEGKTINIQVPRLWTKAYKS